MAAGRWYEAVAGTGLAVFCGDPGDENQEDYWRCGGYIERTRRGFEVRVNRHEETYTNATERTLDAAKATLMRLCGVTKILEAR